MRYSKTVFKTKANAKKFARVFALCEVFHHSFIDGENYGVDTNEDIIGMLKGEWAERELEKIGCEDATQYASFDSLLKWFLSEHLNFKQEQK